MFDAGLVPGLKALLESGPLSFFKIFLFGVSSSYDLLNKRKLF
jgi:hypothetical protein